MKVWKLFCFRIIAGIQFFSKAKTRYNIQSLFQHILVCEVLENKGAYYCFQEIEKCRKTLLKDRRQVQVKDHGAGSAVRSLSQKTMVARIAAKSLSPSGKCKILFHLVRHFRSEYILELGTSLGISTSYLASASSKSKVLTFEGNPEIAALAKEVFIKTNKKNIQLFVGPFLETLDPALEEVPRLDFIFLDGHHEKEPTLRYFEKMLLKSHDHTVLVIDDIHWSKEMEEAWDVLQQHPKVTLTIDLFYMGIIFLNPALSREHICFVPYLMKPWKTGLFGK